jgi:riboflavin synthase
VPAFALCPVASDMFTGLVEEIGRIVAVDVRGPGSRLEIAATTVVEGLKLGDSIAINGACLTAVDFGPEGFAVDCVAETLRRTALGAIQAGAEVNLERAMQLGDRLGGHLVQGHVDGVGEITGCTAEGDGFRLRISVPAELMTFVVEKGSIAIDGVSLTVAERHTDAVTIALIPHTTAHTTLGPSRVGTFSNLEVDLVAKYVAQLAGPYLPVK